jgi:hypothetical protein
MHEFKDGKCKDKDHCDYRCQKDKCEKDGNVNDQACWILTDT